MASTSYTSTHAAEYWNDSSVCGVNVSNFVSAKLQWNNYLSWKEQMLCLLESQGLHGLINGEVAPPPNSPEKGKTKSQAYVGWRRHDRLVKGWILGALSDQVVQTCVGLDSAQDVWLELEKIFTPGPPAPPAGGREQEYNKYLELYKATLSDDWDTARGILEQDLEAGEARSATAIKGLLHVAEGTGKVLDFVEKLVQKMSEKDLSQVLRYRMGRDAIHIAALTGNEDAVRTLVLGIPDLAYEQSRKGWFPIHAAARSAHRDTLELLILHTNDGSEPIPHPGSQPNPNPNPNPNPYAGSSGVSLLCLVIDADFYDIALRLVGKYPDLAMLRNGESDTSALERLSLRDSAFPSTAPRLHLWDLYSSRKRQMIHKEAIQLLKCLCRNMASLNDKEASSIYNGAMMSAARLGIHEVIQEIVGTFPGAVHARKDGHYFFQIAAENRSEQVFNLIYQKRDHKHMYSDITDSRGNTILHLVARLAPPHKLNLVSGAALQMQRELQWFQKVESFLQPHAREQENDDGKTAKIIFTEEHKSLKVDGEKWMKETANSYIIVAALNATIAFAAAITVPGGNDDKTGYPMFKGTTKFTVFTISNAASLLTSVISLLMFLSIMTSRYAEEDFLRALPKRLCTGLFTLFISIFCMMIAFSSSTSLVFGQRHRWFRIVVATLAWTIIFSFARLQYPLLRDVFFSTYCHGNFSKLFHRPQV